MERDVPGTDGDDMTAGERAELDASLEPGIEQAGRGEGASAAEMLRRLRATRNRPCWARCCARCACGWSAPPRPVRAAGVGLGRPVEVEITERR